MEFNIRAAKESDLGMVADVHKECFPNSFSTRLGKNLLVKYYLEFYRECPYLFYVCENADGQICGFVMGYVLGKTNAVSSFMKKNMLAMGAKMFLLLLCADKLAWRKVKRTLCKKKQQTDTANNKVEDRTGQGDLLSICVTDKMKGTGAAAGMVEVYHEALKQHGHSVCYLTCETSNPRGLAFYKKLGYDIAEQSEEKICFRKDLGQ